MNKPRPASVATSWLAASGLLAGASVVSASLGAPVASAQIAQPSNCPADSYLVATRTCQAYFSSTATFKVPSSVTKLSILAVGGGGGGGGGTTYAPGGGGGGGAAKVCTTSIVDLSHTLTITEGAGGAGGEDGTNWIYDHAYGAEYGGPGAAGTASSVASSSILCSADGGQGGQTGWHYLTANLPTTPLYGGGGASGSGVLGGSAAGLQVGNLVTPACISLPWEYNIVASGGGGHFAGNTPSGSTSGSGGDGTSLTSGPFANFYGIYGGGGGGGGGYDCHGTTVAGAGGSGGGGAGANNVVPVVIGNSRHAHGTQQIVATPGQAFSGGGGGGGAGSYLAIQNSSHGVGTPGANGGSGFVVIRFAEPPLTTNAYFATASATLTSADKAALAKFVATAIADNMATVAVAGYTDPRGSVTYNQALSVRRATNTANYLRKLFAAKNASITITSAGKGEKNTFADLALDRVATVSAQGGTYIPPVG